MSNKLLQNQTLTTGLFNQVIDNLSAGVVIADKQGNFVLYNQIAQDSIKILNSNTVEEWQEYFTLYHLDGEMYKKGEQPILRAIKGEEIRGERLLLKNRNLQDGVYLSVDAFPLKEDDEIVGGVAVFCDITDRVKMEKLFAEFADRFEHMKFLLEKSLK